jgi:hypothetical protein
MQHIANVSHRTEASSLLVQAFSAQPARFFTTESFRPHIITIILAEFPSLPAPNGLGAKSIFNASWPRPAVCPYPCRGSSNAKQSSSHLLKQRNHLYVPSIYHIISPNSHFPVHPPWPALHLSPVVILNE